MDKENFKLNSDAKRKIGYNYYMPDNERPPVRRVVRPKAVPPRNTNVGANIRRAPERRMPDDRVPVRRVSEGRVPERRAPTRRMPERQAAVPAYADYSDEFYPEETYEKPKKRWLKKLIIGTAIFCVITILFNIAFFFYSGHIWFNEPRKRDYPVRGAVIEQSLGKVDWDTMSHQTISFVYIRATKGTTGIDEQYSDNRRGVNKTDLLSGYYHEFDFRTDGEKQAEHFIEQCGDMSGRLRPMVKLTKYGIYNLKMKDADKVRANLQAFLDRVEEEYGRRCVIMCDSACYKKYVKDDFSDYTLWTISHFGKPDEDSGWAMWEYNPRVRSEGYSNKKKYFSMSVYREGKDIENFKKNLLMD